MRVAVTLCLAVLACGCAAVAQDQRPAGPETTWSHGQTPQSVSDELLTADRAFAARENSVEELANMLHDDVVVMAAPVPGFSNGRLEALAHLARAAGSDQTRFERTPIRVGVSADGQHGFTFGYVTMHLPDETVRQGKYVAYWVRSAEGWRASLFKLLPRPEGDVSLEMMAPSLPGELVAPTNDEPLLATYRQSLAAREQAFSDEAQRIGVGPAFAVFGRSDAINVGGGPTFVVGAEAIGAAQPGPPGSPVTWSAGEGVLVASSGDLGVTWGFLQRSGPIEPGRLGAIPFFTVWRRESVDDPWLYIAE